jgi:hypothetical protein
LIVVFPFIFDVVFRSTVWMFCRKQLAMLWLYGRERILHWLD